MHQSKVTPRLLRIVAFALFALPAFASAQDRWPVTAEAYLGLTRGHSDDDARFRGGRGGILAEVLVGARIHSVARAGAFLAVHAGFHGMNIVRTADCLLAPNGGCVPWFPGVGVVSSLAGWESRSTNLRLLVGPALVMPEEDENTAGFVGRFDAALPLITHISAVASLNTLVVPSYNSDRFYYLAFGVGLRLR